MLFYIDVGILFLDRLISLNTHYFMIDYIYLMIQLLNTFVRNVIVIK